MSNKMTIVPGNKRHRLPTESGGFLSETEEHSLAVRWREKGDILAAKQLAAAHVGLVRRIAAAYLPSGHPYADLVGVGNIGLMEGIKRFDPARGTRVSTYATWWIHAKIKLYIREMHGPMCVFSKTTLARKVFDHARRVTRELEGAGKEATPEALAEAIGVPIGTVKAVLPFLSGHTSLDQNPGLNNVAGRGGATAEEHLAEAEQKHRRLQLLRSAMSQLNESEQLVIREHFLREDSRPLSEIRAELGVSRQRTSQIKLKALEKLNEIMTANGLG